MTNKYLEKIAAKVKAGKALEMGLTVYTVDKHRKKNAKEKTRPTVRKFSRMNNVKR